MATATKTKVDPEDLVDIPAGAKLVWVRPKTIANWLTQGKLTRYPTPRQGHRQAHRAGQ
jgi:hypothetical protein